MKREFRILLLFLCIILVSTSLLIGIIPNHNAQNQSLEDAELASLMWAIDGTDVIIAPLSQHEHEICSDGAGGAIIVYRDNRGVYSDIYAQRINSSGDVLWGVNGSSICTADEYQKEPHICSDGYDGAVITWMDRRTGVAGTNYDVYAQRINSTGHAQWEVNGTRLCNATSTQEYLQICNDGNGGAIVTWRDARGSDTDIYVQRINATGHVKWADNGVRLFNGTGNDESSKILSDRQGGAFVTWQYVNGSNRHIFAQHVDLNGQIQWTFNETVVCNITGQHGSPEICSDGDSGMIISWIDNRAPPSNIYAQRITSNGMKLWGANGTAICDANDGQTSHKIMNYSNNGAILTWADYRNGNYDIYAQRINSSGHGKWLQNGIPICTLPREQHFPALCTDGSGGAIIAWRDLRDSTTLLINIYAQRINSSGHVQWTNDGTSITKAPEEQSEPRICYDGTTGAYIVWKDAKMGGIGFDLFAQYIDNIPTSTHPTDIITTAGAADTIGWIIYDDSPTGKYRIWANNTDGLYYIWRNWTTWTDSNPLDVDINYTVPGMFEYILEYYDNELFLFGTNDSVVVTIIDQLPSSNQPADITTSALDWDSIEWQLYDDFGGSHFRVWANDTTGKSRVWIDWTSWTNNVPIFIPINRLSLGTFNYTIEFNSSTNQIIYDTVLVTIVAPTSGPTDLNSIIGVLGLLLVGSIVFTIAIYVRLNNKIKKLSKSQPLPKKSLPKTK